MALTEEKVHKMIFEAVDAVLAGVENMGFAKKEDLERLEKKVDFLNDKVESHYADHKDQIDGLKADLSMTVTRKEFNSKIKSN